MPIYEYRCSKCGRVFEAIQKFSDAPLTVDEQCGGAVERLLSAPALQFKGTGWYVTDYAKGSGNKPKNENKGESKAESKAEGKSGSESKSPDAPAKADSKPAPSTKDS